MEFEFVVKCGEVIFKSYGLFVNSFYEFEFKFFDYWNFKFEFKSWFIGLFCLVEKFGYERLEKFIWF